MFRRLLVVVVMMASSASAGTVLKVDFNSNQDSGGDSSTAGDPSLSVANHNQEGWSSYHANHEVAAEFSTANYGGITVTPAWSNTTDNRVQQSIDRGAGNDNTWDDAEGDLNLVTDFIGIDTRTGNGGNGNWDGTTGTPTYMTLTLGGLAAGVYDWTSFHHDTENVHGPFAVWLSTDGGSSYTQLVDGLMTDGSEGGNPESAAREHGPDAYLLPSTYNTSFTANGTDDVVMRFAPHSGIAVHRQIWGMNAFELTEMPPAIAKNPSPADEATDVPGPVVLSWTAGDYAPAVNGHKVFLSDNLADVSAGLATTERGIVSDPVFDAAALPFALEYSTTYYWRVDEANVPGGTWDAGGVWSFTMEPYSIAIAGQLITATADSNDAGQGPENTINGSGLDADDLHSVELTDMWISGTGAPQPAWIQYEFDKVYKLHQMLVWNHNSVLEPAIGFGIRDATIEYSLDGTNWTALTREFVRAPGAAGYAADTPVDFAGAAAKYVKITANNNWGGIPGLTQCGLSEVRFLYIPVRARQPYPASGATGRDVDNVTLRWATGRGAASHEVYVSANEQAVIDETISPVSIAAGSGYVSYDTGELDLGQTYYWKVNEVNDAETPATWQGDVWSFTTAAYFVVEDFEDYDDLCNRIFYTWEEGGGYNANVECGILPSGGNGTGSLGGYAEAPYAEQTITHDGSFQSMPFEYLNDGSTGKALYSETARAFDPPQDWTKYGIKALSLWFHGDPNNDATEQMYVKLNGSPVTYDGNVNDLTRTAWQEWHIDLKDFAGVDLGNVTEISIGFERSGVAGGSGVVYFDDIRLYPARCVAEVRQPGADLNDDCVVDYLDLQIIGNQWLGSGLLVTPQQAGNAGLVAHYEFEGTADDSVGARHGITTGGPSYAAGKVGQAIDLDGLNDYVFIDGSFQLPEYTMAVWFRCDGGSGNRDILSAYAPGVVHGILLELQGAGTLRYLHRYPLGTGGGSNIYTTTTYDDGAWHHAAIVKSETEIVLYTNGENVGSTPDSSVFDPADAFGLAVGILDNERTPLARLFVGAMDDIRIYERALSQAEVASLAGRTEPFSEPFDLNVDGTVDSKDFAALADVWLDEQLWP